MVKKVIVRKAVTKKCNYKTILLIITLFCVCYTSSFPTKDLHSKPDLQGFDIKQTPAAAVIKEASPMLVVTSKSFSISFKTKTIIYVYQYSNPLVRKTKNDCISLLHNFFQKIKKFAEIFYLLE